MTTTAADAARTVANALLDLAAALDRDASASAPPRARDQMGPPAPAARPAPPRPPPGDGFCVPFGRDKGRFLIDVDDACLKWLASALETSISDPEKSTYAAKNRRDLSAVRDEQNRRFVR